MFSGYKWREKNNIIGFASSELYDTLTKNIKRKSSRSFLHHQISLSDDFPHYQYAMYYLNWEMFYHNRSFGYDLLQTNLRCYTISVKA